jgi:Transposase
MEAKRYIGIDLHRNCFTACLRLENGRNYLTQWQLEDMAKFVAKLRPTDQAAVEVTGNTRLFHDAVAPHVERVVAVNPSQFKVIAHSVKKTDPNDARNLALYLAKDLLPEVRMKDKTQAQIASLTQTRDTMVKAAHGAEEQGEQSLLGARRESQQGIAGQRERAEGRPGNALRPAGESRAEDHHRSDSQPEQEHCGAGGDHRQGRPEAGRA